MTPAMDLEINPVAPVFLKYSNMFTISTSKSQYPRCPLPLHISKEQDHPSSLNSSALFQNDSQGRGLPRSPLSSESIIKNRAKKGFDNKIHFMLFYQIVARK